MKHLYIFLVLALVLCCTVLYDCGGESAPETVPAEPAGADYETVLFDAGSVHRIDIRIAEEDWNDLLANAAEKNKYKIRIEIDGEIVEDVAFSAKGNSSLMFVAAEPGSSRYSFKVNFGKYVKGQTFHGLNKLSLNNNFGDPTYMKDYISYGIFRRAGVPTPLTSYVWLTINGRDHGLYLAVEDESESFLERAYGGEGAVWKPECKDLELTPEMIAEIKKNGLSMESDPHGGDLVYLDDNPESYPDIFENNETKAEEEDKLAVIAALKCLSEGTDPAAFLDTDEIIRFFAAHNFVLNYDSYTGLMLHNMVLVGSGGRLSLVPWDYNLAFGSFTPVVGNESLLDATGILNQGIDSPLIGVTEDNRPMWKWIAKDEVCLKQYHNALGALVTDFFASGAFEREFSDLYEMLLPYVTKDPTAFYTADEYRTACEILKQFCMRRAESVRRQLDGTLSSVNSEQAGPERVDASDLRIMDMGVAVKGAAQQ